MVRLVPCFFFLLLPEPSPQMLKQLRGDNQFGKVRVGTKLGDLNKTYGMSGFQVTKRL